MKKTSCRNGTWLNVFHVKYSNVLKLEPSNTYYQLHYKKKISTRVKAINNDSLCGLLVVSGSCVSRSHKFEI